MCIHMERIGYGGLSAAAAELVKKKFYHVQSEFEQTTRPSSPVKQE